MKRYYFSQYGYFWSANKKQTIELLTIGSVNGYINLDNLKEVKNKPNSYNIFYPLDWNKDDFKFELDYLLNE